ncbi:MAG: rhodanese-like domain-containing protein [Acidobacteriota bacterium]
MNEISTSKACDIKELKTRLEDGNCSLLDVREYAEFSGGRVAGAQLIPLGDVERRYAEIDRGNPVYVMCRSGKRGAEAQKKLTALGFSDVKNVSGGIDAWMAAGFPVERDANPVWSLERQVRFVAGSFVVLGVLLSLISPYFILLSAFVGAGLVFAAVTDTCGMGMALARMPWNKQTGAECETSVRSV